MKKFFLNSYLKTADNSGAKVVKVINIKQLPLSLTKDFNNMYLLFVLVKVALPYKKVKRGDKLCAFFLQTRTLQKRLASFTKNKLSLVVLLKGITELLPIANRIFCKVSLELRSLGFLRIILISKGFY